MAPAIFQEGLCEPFAKRPSDWVALALGIVLIGFVVVAWCRHRYYVSSQDQELRKVRAHVTSLSAKYWASQDICERLHSLLGEERLACEDLRTEVGKARAQLAVLEGRTASLSRSLALLQREPASPVAGPSQSQEPVRGLGIDLFPTTSTLASSNVSPTPNLAAFCTRILGRPPSPISSAALGAIERRGAERRPQLTVDTMVTSREPVGSPTPIAMRGERTIAGPGIPARKMTRDATVTAPHARQSMTAERGTITPPSSMSPMIRQPMGTLADELAGFGDDLDLFDVGSDDDGYGGDDPNINRGRWTSDSNILSPTSPVREASPVSPVSSGSAVLNIPPVSPPSSPDLSGCRARDEPAEGAAPTSPSLRTSLDGAVVHEARQVTIRRGAGSVVTSPQPSQPSHMVFYSTT